MENASKALIIAGAILISILLIGVGMMVFQGAQGGIEGAIAQMSSQEKEMFNQNFTRYEGTKTTGSNVRALIQNVISSNNTNQETEGKLVSLSIGGTEYPVTSADLKTNEISKAKVGINTGATYNVVLEYNNGGLVNKVVITKNS